MKNEQRFSFYITRGLLDLIENELKQDLKVLVEKAVLWGREPGRQFPHDVAPDKMIPRPMWLDVDMVSWIRSRIPLRCRSGVVERMLINWLIAHDWVKPEALAKKELLCSA